MRFLLLALSMAALVMNLPASRGPGPRFRNPTTQEASEMLYQEEPQVIFIDPLQEPKLEILHLPFWTTPQESGPILI